MSDEQLLRIAEWCRENGHEVACARCNRNLAEVRRYDDLPVITSADGAICSRCTTQKERKTAMSDERTDWQEKCDGIRPLWKECAELRETGMKWREISEHIQREYGYYVSEQNVCAQVGRYQGRWNRSDDDDGEGEDENPFHDGGEEVTPPSAGPGAASGADDADGGLTPQLTPRQAAGPGNDACRLEIEMPGIELRVTGAGPVEYMQKIMHIQNVCAIGRQIALPAITDDDLARLDEAAYGAGAYSN